MPTDTFFYGFFKTYPHLDLVGATLDAGYLQFDGVLIPAAETVERIATLRRESGEPQGEVLDWLQTFLRYPYPQLGWEGIARMFTLEDLRKTRFGSVGDRLRQQIQALAVHLWGRY